MVEELSALDAELDRLGVEPVADSAALASSYAGPIGGLSDVDAALSALAAGLDASGIVAPRALSMVPPMALPLRSALPPPEPPRAADSVRPSGSLRPSESVRPGDSMRPGESTRPGDAARPFEGVRASDPDSVELLLPEPVREREEHSGELQLEGEAPASGAFALDALGPDEPVTEDVSFEDADLEELIEVEASKPYYEDSGRISEADRLVDEEFAELFSDAPHEPLGYGEDDTEIFDSGAIAAIKAKGELEPIENAFNAEELDSAEFEIVMESSNDDRPHESSTSSIPSASTPPEKRPSFLGRLFGRKDE